MAIESRHNPIALILTRQNVPTLDRKKYSSAEGLRQGAYILSDPSRELTPQLILIATGSEVSLIVEAQKKLQAQGFIVRTVSMPSWELFDLQPQEYRDFVLPPSIPAKLSVEAGVSQGWKRYVGCHGASIAIDKFGASAPGSVMMHQYGFTVDHICQKSIALMEKVK